MRAEVSAIVRGIAAVVAGGVCVAALEAQAPRVSMLPVQGTVSMVTVADTNVTVQIGKTGVVVVDAPPVDAVAAVMVEIRKLTDKPIRYIVNTNADADHVGGNAALVSAVVGREVRGAPMGALTGLGATLGRPSIIAHTNVLGRMSTSTPAPSAAALPTTA